MFIQVVKKELDGFDYTNDDGLKELVPFIMIKVAHNIYGEDDTVTVSVDAMWNLVTKGKRKLRKTQRECLLDWFKWYTGIEEIDYENEFTFTVKLFNKKDKFIKFDMKQIVKIFNEYRFDNIDVVLAIVLRTYSHMNGDYVGISKDELLEQVRHDYVGDDVFDVKKPNTWFKMYDVKYLLSMSTNFVAFPNVENDFLVRRYDTDKVVMDKPFISEQNFNKHMKNLEELGIICKVQTTYGQRNNKVVFCQADHKEVCEALYKRYDELATLGKKHKDDVEKVEEEIEEEVPTEHDTTFMVRGRDRGKRW